MATASVKECSICNHEYDEDQRCPRMLPCAHSLCTFCIDQLITRNEKTCPLCRKDFEARSVKEFGKNTAYLDLLTHVKEIETKAAKGIDMSRSEMVAKMKQKSCEINLQNISSCKETREHIKTLMNNNSELERSISQILMKIKYDIKSKISELEEKCETKVQYLRNENEKLKKLMTEAEEKQQEFEKVKVVLEEAATLVKVDIAIDEAEASNTILENWLPNLKTEVSRDEKIHQSISKSMQSTDEKLTCIKDILILPVEDDDGIIEHMAAMTLQDENQTQITPEILQRMNATTRCLVSLGGIYAVQKLKGKTRYGRLSLFEKKLCLHHLTEKRLPLDVCTVRFEEVMRLVDPSSRLTFLELANEETTLGKIFIRLSPDTKRAQNFSLLTTGEEGPSFIQTNIYNIKKQDTKETVICGGYIINNQRTWKALVPGAGEEKGGVLQGMLTKGSVNGCKGAKNFEYTDEVGSAFVITTEVKTSVSSPVIFGMAEKGLNILSEAKEIYPDIKSFKIVDCGIVLIESS